MHTHYTFIFAAIAIVAGITAVSAVIAQAQAQNGGFASVNTQITEDRVIITVELPGAEPIPPGPIVIIPPNETEGEDNATVILPPPVDNQTGEQPPQNITIIEPDGNVTQVPPGNITQTPGNVTVIDPPAPEPCGCPPGPTLPVEPGDNATTIVGNDTTVVVEPPVATQLPVIPEEGGGNGDGDGNGNGDGNGDEGGG